MQPVRTRNPPRAHARATSEYPTHAPPARRRLKVATAPTPQYPRSSGARGRPLSSLQGAKEARGAVQLARGLSGGEAQGGEASAEAGPQGGAVGLYGGPPAHPPQEGKALQRALSLEEGRRAVLQPGDAGPPAKRP